MLTARQEQVLAAFENYLNEHGYAPTQAVHAELVGLGMSEIRRHRNRLVKLGLIQWGKTVVMVRRQATVISRN